MDQIILVCGIWRFEDSWSFLVDQSQGCRIIGIDEDIRFDDFLGMVYADFGLNQQSHVIKLSYMSNLVIHSLPKDTPPVFVSNDRQLQVFVHQFRKETIRLCVEIFSRSRVSGSFPVEGNIEGKVQCKWENYDASYNRVDPYPSRVDPWSNRAHQYHSRVDPYPNRVEPSHSRVDPSHSRVDAFSDRVLHLFSRGGLNSEPMPQNVKQETEHADDEDAEFRFDYCDDVDGASSDDEEYISVRRKSKEEEKKNLSEKTMELDLKAEYLNIEISALELAIGQRYSSKKELVIRLKILSVLQRFDFDVVASSKTVFDVKCWVPNCRWRVRASPTDDSGCFYVRQYRGEHNCSVTERSGRSRQATTEVLGRLYMEFVGGIGPSVLPRHVADSMNKHFGLKLKYWKAHRTLREARALVTGTCESSFHELPSYLFAIRRANPGTVIKLEVDGQDKFKFLFIAFDASIRGFPYMRKVVVVDGTFLQGKYKGTLLTATMQDGNFNIFPMAFGVVDTENDESWEWFFIQLNRVIPDDRELAIISDRHKSIAKAIKNVYPLASRGICTYHLRKNILSKFRGGEPFKLFKKAATAYRVDEFNDIFAQIEALDPKLHAYLRRADVRLWSRVHFPGNRYNFTTSNIAESINHALSEARTFPIVQLVDAIRAMLTRWFAKRKTKARLTSTILTTAVEKLLKTRVEEARQYNVQDIDEHQAIVTRSQSSHLVNLSEKTCSCMRFNVEKIPCVHAIAVAEAWKRPSIELTHIYYHTTYLYNAYSNTIFPRDAAIPVPLDVSRKVCNPPTVRQQPGRPKKSRIKGWFECSEQSKRPRKITACSKCKQLGHNARTCSDRVQS